MSNKIKTTDDFVDPSDHIMHIHDVRESLIAFAQYHVDRALKAAAENAQILQDGKSVGQDYVWEAYNTSRKDVNYEINKESILNSYPKENIK